MHRKVDKIIKEKEQVKIMEKRDDTSQQRQIDHFVTDMDVLIHAHPPREAEPDRTVVWLLPKDHAGARKAARLWQECFRNEVFMKAGWDAVAAEPNAHQTSRRYHAGQIGAVESSSADAGHSRRTN